MGLIKMPCLMVGNHAGVVEQISAVLSDIPGYLRRGAAVMFTCLPPPYQDRPCMIELCSIIVLPYLLCSWKLPVSGTIR